MQPPPPLTVPGRPGRARAGPPPSRAPCSPQHSAKVRRSVSAFTARHPSPGHTPSAGWLSCCQPCTSNRAGGGRRASAGPACTAQRTGRAAAPRRAPAGRRACRAATASQPGCHRVQFPTTQARQPASQPRVSRGSLPHLRQLQATTCILATWRLRPQAGHWLRQAGSSHTAARTPPPPAWQPAQPSPPVPVPLPLLFLLTLLPLLALPAGTR